MGNMTEKDGILAYASDLEHERNRLAEMISKKTAAGETVSGRLITLFNKAAAHYTTVKKELDEVERHEAEKAERENKRKNIFRFYLPGEDITLLKTIAKKKHTTTSALVRTIIQGYLLERGQK